MSPGQNPHTLLGRIRFLNRCTECFRTGEPLPESLCFVPREVCYKICKDSSRKTLVPVWDHPNQPPTRKTARCTIEPKKGTCIRTSGEEYYNSHGLWVKISKEQLEEYRSGVELEEGWILACKHAEGGDRLVPVEAPDTASRQQQLFGYDHKPCNRWEQVADAESCLHLGGQPKVAERDEAAVQKLRVVKQDCVSKGVFVKEDPSGGAGCLTDGDTETYWESDGMQGQHWIRLHMKRGTVVNKLILTVDSTDDTYMPKRVTVFGGEGDNLKKYSDVTIEDNLIGEVCVLEDMTSHLPIIEIRIEECRDGGIDVRIRGLKIKSSCERDLGLNADVFQSPHLVRYPRLECTPPDVLYRRALVILRFISLLDGLLPHLVPAWDYSLGTFNQIKSIKQFLLLSKRRSALIIQCLKDSESSKPNFMPRLYINRRLAMEHRDNPSLDPTCKNAVFTQVYEGLKPSDKYEKTLDYRWPARHDQWWECKFIAEGIIDQGGGFRDSLADMSEELCPSSAECAMPLPFFTRTSNQVAGEARDFYVPNPSCREFQKYEWIGQLMGAALRGKDFLVLALPGLVWKQLTGESISWNEDFPAVDSVLVKLLEAMEHMDKETFDFKFGQELVYSTPLSDGRLVELIPGGGSVVVRYEDRMEFVRLVQKSRLEESKEQIAAIQAGLMKVVPQAVLDLLTWQEVEKKVCGDPEITVEALKRLSEYCRYTNIQGLDNETETPVILVWEDRSRFLRFVTGRSRSDEYCVCVCVCVHSAKVCEEKLRYAAYNCVAIDTDMSPWEE
uniref:HECT domain containing 3 n=1 Tax=Astyanax mexicanus TaxID=7994 RepID=A0A8B9J7I2_ASTMX